MIKKLLFSVLILLLVSSFTYAQRTITGTVVDDTGNPLPGASVLVKGSGTGTTTDFDGKFSVNVPNNEAILVISFVGYSTKEITIGDQSNINITLSEDSQALQEVVVSVLGFKEKRDDVASTYSVIETESILSAKEPTLVNSLAGKASGVNISGTSADPGAGSNIQIRGISSLNGGAPLIVVDGIPINNSNIEGIASDADGGISQQSRLNDINPDDIETIQVYKGASAGSLYGSRALGGVIVITTKRGKEGKLRASFSSTLAFDEINRKHPLQTKFGQGSNGSYSPTNANSWGDKISDRSGGADEINTSGQYFEATDGTRYYPITQRNSSEVYTNSNFDQVFQTGVTNENKINLSGGNEKATFYFSASHLDQKGIMINSDYFKNTFTVGNTYKLADWLTASSKIVYSNNKSNRIQQGSNTAGIYLGLLRNPPDFDITHYIGTYYDNNGNPTPLRHRSYRRYLGNTANPTYNNPLWTIYEQTSDTEVDRLIGSIDFTLKATSWLDFVVRGGIDTYNDDRVYFFPMFSADGANNGRYQNEVFKNNEYTGEIISIANFNITDDIATKITVGSAISDFRRKQTYVEALDFLFNSRLKNPNIAAIRDEIERNTIARYFRLYTVANFEYKDLLNLNASLTYEDASASYKSLVYPSLELGLKWSNLLNLDNNSKLSFGKLRLAYGEVGLPPSPHLWETGYETATYSTYSDGISLTAFGGGFRLDDDLGNAQLEFEKKKEYEVGLDFRFFKNRLKLSGTYYYNKTDDIVLPVNLNPSSGFDTYYGNIASIENKGFEFEFDYDFLKKQNWSVGLYGNLSTNKNEVLELEEGAIVNFSPGSSIISAAIVGEPVGILIGSAALRNSDGSLDLDANGFPQLDASGSKVLGDPNPDWRGAAGIRANYKNLSLNVLFETSQGNDMAERTRYVLYGFGTHADTGNEVIPTQDIVNYAGTVIPAGTTVRGNIADFGGGPVLLDQSWYTSLGGGFGSSVINEFAIGDASWTRLREISLNYNLKGGVIEKIGLESVQLSVTGRNLVLWTDIKGIDPDVNQFGVGLGKGLDYFTNPSSKSYVFGLTINY